MKRYTQLVKESATSADVNPGNGLGVTNHYTPIENILTDIRNLYCCKMGIVAAPGEDGVSIKLHSTKFVNKNAISNSLYDMTIVDNCTSLDAYIKMKGLTKVTLVNLGMYYVVYYSPEDIATAAIPAKDGQTVEVNPVLHSCPSPVPVPVPVAAVDLGCPCPSCIGFGCESKLEDVTESLLDEFEMTTLTQINEDDDDVEVEDETHKALVEILKTKDKVKAAKKLEAIIGKEMSLPREFYFAAVKSKSGEESIALRWKYTKKVAHGQSTEITKSLINIFGFGKDAIWVGDYDNDTMFVLPDEVKNLIDNILDLLGAEKTKDEAVFALSENPEKKADREDDENKDDQKDEAPEDDKKNDEDAEDTKDASKDEGEDTEDDPLRDEDDDKNNE